MRNFGKLLKDVGEEDEAAIEFTAGIENTAELCAP